MAPPLEALSDKVVATLNNWNFQPDKGTTIKTVEKHINPDLEWYWEIKRKVQVGYIWKKAHHTVEQHTLLPNTLKLVLSHTDFAHSVCCSLIDKDVQQVDVMASVNFRSSFHKLAKEGLTNSFSQYALCGAFAQMVGASRFVASSTDIGGWACP